MVVPNRKNSYKFGENECRPNDFLTSEKGMLGVKKKGPEKGI